MVYTRDRVNELINKFLQTIKLRHSIEKAYLFGSHAKGNADNYSDIDIAHVLDKKIVIG